MKADFHMHTSFSADADRNSTPKTMIEAAIQKGLQTICITDHQDSDFPIRNTEGEFNIDFENYFSVLHSLQERYKDKINIRIGVEFGLQPHLGKVYQVLTHKYPFDFVIGSVHIYDRLDPYYGEYFQNKTDEEAYRRAFEITLDNVKNISDFDVLGHFDYIVRYGRTQAQSYSYKKYADLIDEILNYLIGHGKGLELNTAGLKYGLGFAHPHTDILKRYKELGGEIITVGSDGHTPQSLAYDFHKVSDILKACGFTYYTEFDKRLPKFCQLP